ncbi:MAG: phosphorylase [Bacteroidetes bacterium HGW-Bacteroidetes-9]|jgi:uridine phosphorylase|nr:MAG: phosphorylase [Bacteroidetes bacterium HGW-Bacteroidetes-9]
MSRIGESELILNPDGSVYHLKLQPDELAGDIIVVGDPGRVANVSKHFDRIELTRQNREIVTHTGYVGEKRITVLSTGMGTDNIDIVLNELDALVNIDLGRREKKSGHTALNIIRLGTSGALQAGVPVDSVVASTHGIGLDGMLYYYKKLPEVMDTEITEAFIKQTSWHPHFPRPYAVACSPELLRHVGEGYLHGMTATSPGFYGPQGRILRLETTHPDLNQAIAGFDFKGQKILNFEMETSALYGLGLMLGHNTLTLCAIIANRVEKKFSKDYHPVIDKLIVNVIDKLVSLP